MVAVRILGIDPGTVVVGFACLEVETRRPRSSARSLPIALRAANVCEGVGGSTGSTRLVEAGAVRLGSDRDPIASRLGRLAAAFDDWFGRFAPDEVALETAYAGKSIRSALRIGEARGVVLAQAHRWGLEVHEYAPARIKRCVAGHGSASKAAVAAFALRRLGAPPLSGSADASDAVAVALCHVEDRRRPPRLGAGRTPADVDN